MPTLDVIFRKDRRDGCIEAIFPSIPGTDEHDFTIYANGGHGIGEYDWYRTHTRPSSPEEYAPLLAELRSIYERPDDPERVTLRPMLRMQPHHHQQRKEACR